MPTTTNDISAFYAGSKPVEKLYAGSTEVWSGAAEPVEPIAIREIGAAVITGVLGDHTASLPTHESGDLLVVHVGIDGGIVTTLTDPGDGWTYIRYERSPDMAVCWKTAASNNETPPTMVQGGVAVGIISRATSWVGVGSVVAAADVFAPWLDSADEQFMRLQSVETVVDGSVVFYIASSNDDNGWTSVTGDGFEWLYRTDQSTHSAGNSIGAAMKEMPTAGVTGEGTLIATTNFTAADYGLSAPLILQPPV